MQAICTAPYASAHVCLTSDWQAQGRQRKKGCSLDWLSCAFTAEDLKLHGSHWNALSERQLAATVAESCMGSSSVSQQHFNSLDSLASLLCCSTKAEFFCSAPKGQYVPSLTLPDLPVTAFFIHCGLCRGRKTEILKGTSPSGSY